MRRLWTLHLPPAMFFRIEDKFESNAIRLPHSGEESMKSETGKKLTDAVPFRMLRLVVESCNGLVGVHRCGLH